MKIKTLLIALSIVSFLSFAFTSCSKDDEMGIGESIGSNPPTYSNAKTTNGLQADSIAVFELPKE